MADLQAQIDALIAQIATHSEYLRGQADALTLWLATIVRELLKESPAMHNVLLAQSHQLLLDIERAAPSPREQGAESVHRPLAELLMEHR